MTSRITTFTLVLVMTLSVMPVFSAELWDRPDEAGTWMPWETGCTGVQGALRAEWEKRLREVAALVCVCGVFREIRGYYPHLTWCVQSLRGGPYEGSLASPRSSRRSRRSAASSGSSTT